MTANWQIADWHFDASAQRLSRGAEQVQLPHKVSEVLRCLVLDAGQVVTRETLIERVWDGNRYTGARGLTNAIWQLRRLLDAADPQAESAIETISRNGYRLRAPVRSALEPLAAEPAPVGAEASAASAIRRPVAVRLIAGLAVLGLLGLLIAILAGRTAPPSPVNPDALERVPLTVLDGSEEYPALSRDGRWLAFMWERPDHPARIMVADLHDPQSTPRDVSVGPVDEARPQWSPDGRRLSLLRISAEHDCEILIRDLDTQRDAPVGPCFYERLHQVYDWSPDGRTMAIARRSAEDGTVGIVLRDLADGAERRLTRPPSGEQDSQIAWSPDGRHIAFVRRNLSVGELYVVGADGRGLRQLTRDAAPIYGLAWQGDGQGLVFNSMRDGRFALWQLPVAGGTPRLYAALDTPFNLTPLPGSAHGVAVSQHRSAEFIDVLSADGRSTLATLSSSGRDMYAQWSPVLDRLLFLSTRGRSLELWSGRPDGSEVRRVEALDGVPAIPAWSPVDERYAVSMHVKGAAHEALFVAAGEQAPLEPVLDDGHDYPTVSWLPDGSGLVVASNRDGRWGLWRFDFADGALTKLTDAPGMYGQLTADGALYYARRDVPGLWRRRADGRTDRIVPELGLDDWGNWELRGDALYFVRRDAGHDRLMRSDPDGRDAQPILELPRNAIRYYRGLSVTDDGRLVLTMLGRRQADIVALRPAGERS